ncbi:MAG: hypothetical protein IKL52_06495 [Candidatus Gastranaerophilales bacterium]|nr:hypothetical protein [Candidatus Gastranaerophilales bacterium]
MKKILALGVVLALSTSMTLAATSFGTSLKNAVKQDIETMKKETKDYNASVKEAAKKDMEAKAAANKKALEAKAAANQKAAQAKKAQKIKEINAKIAELNKEKASIQNAKDMTYTEKNIKTKLIEKQLKYHNDQLEALK